MPPAPIRRMAVNLLARAGVREVPSIADRETENAWQWLDEHGTAHPGQETFDSAPPVGVWGVPEDRVIGVDRPYALHLRWGNREYLTEYEDQFMEQSVNAATQFEVLDPEAFLNFANAFQANPIRLEKDLKVNHVLHLLQDWQPTGFDVALTGGTALSKAYGAIARFSEDIDLQLYPHRPGTADLDAKQCVWDDFRAYLTDKVFPFIEGSRFDNRQTRFAAGADGRGRDIQHVSALYDSRFREFLGDAQRPVTAPDVRGSKRPWTVRYDLAFIDSDERPPTTRRIVEALPNVLEFADDYVGQWECVDPVHIAIGKLAHLDDVMAGRKSLTDKQGTRPVSIMRHLQDLGEIRELLLTSPASRTIVDALPPGALGTVRAGLKEWSASPTMEVSFNEYSKLMRPHQDSAMVPMFQTGTAPAELHAEQMGKRIIRVRRGRRRRRRTRRTPPAERHVLNELGRGTAHARPQPPAFRNRSATAVCPRSTA